MKMVTVEKKFPQLLSGELKPDSEYSEPLVVKTSRAGTLYIDDGGVSMSFGHGILSSEEAVNNITLFRNSQGRVRSIDLGPPPLRFRSVDLGLTSRELDELFSGLRFAGVSYRLLHGEFEPADEQEVFPYLPIETPITLNNS